MDIVKNKKKEVKLTGVNRIIFEYCHFHFPFEDELIDKTRLIYKMLNTKDIDFDEYVNVCINNSGEWFLGYPPDFIHISDKLYITEELYNRKLKYGEIMGFGEVDILGNECYGNY